MLLFSPHPTANFLNYDRVIRQIMVSDEIDRMAFFEARERIMGRPTYRGPVDGIGIARNENHPLLHAARAAS